MVNLFSSRFAFWVGLSLTIFTGLTNIGFLAIDDYEYTVAAVVPAQNFSYLDLVPLVDMRSPVPSMWLLTIAKAGLWLGLDSPTDQYRLVLTVLGIFSFCTVFFSTSKIVSGHSRRHAEWLMACFFLMPLILSRSMFESLAIPFLLVSVMFADRYDQQSRLVDLAAATAWLAVACAFRFQLGLCGVAVLALPAIKRKWGHFSLVAVFSLALFCLLGVPDWIFKGQWHVSLKSYVSYNFAHASSFGVTPFYSFGLLFLGLSLPPFLLSRYRGFTWRSAYRPLLPVILYFAVFVVAHSLVPHKEERFMIPMLPLFLILVSPLVAYLWSTPWRRRFAVVLNFCLLPIVCWSEPQRNVIDLVKFLNASPGYRTLVAVDDTLVLFPAAFALRRPQIIYAASDHPQSLFAIRDCATAVVVRQDIRKKMDPFFDRWHRIGLFEPAFIEGVLVKLNPKHNARRGSLELFVHASCDR